MNQPAIFISCVSPEFRQTRSRVAAILTRLGYTPVIQEIFGTEPGDLRQVLRDKVDACEGLIQSARGFVVRPPGGVGLVRAKRSGYPQKLLAQV